VALGKARRAPANAGAPMKRLRILVVSTVYNSTPPVGYGGIQRVVHWLVEALLRQGHQVTLMAPPRSHCSGRTVHVAAYDPELPWSAVRGSGDLLSEEPLYDAIKAHLASERYDVLHDWSFQSLFAQRHPSAMPFVISTCIPPGPGFARANLVASSAAHAALVGATTRHVHYGLPLHDWPFSLDKSAAPIHIAKLARFKAQHLAILAAMRASSPLTIAGNIENARYYRWVIRPLLALARGVTYIGEVDGTQTHLLKAGALVQTPRWFDCFPLVVLEALASATPVISLAAGGVPEQVQHGKTGFLCHSVGELADAFRHLGDINPAACRSDAEQRFSDATMARNYVALYERAIAGDRW